MYALTPTLILLVGAGCSEGAGQAEAAAKEDGPPPARVEVAQALRGTLTDRWAFMGDVRPLHRSELAAGASGAVTRTEVREGDRVKPGQLLLEVDTALGRARLRVAEANVAQSDAALRQARRELTRFRRLGRKSVAALELDRAEARVATLEAQLAAHRAAVSEARAQLARHRVSSPYAAVVAHRHVDPGDWVEPGTHVLDVVSLDEVEVVVDGSARLLNYVAVGDKATVGPEKIPAAVVGVVPALDPVARTARVRLKPDGGPLRPGSAVSVTFAVKRGGEGVVVPRDALIRGAVDTRVMRVVDGRAQPDSVEVLATAGDQALVVGKRLAPGDRVVVRGNERLRPGQPVRGAP